jgi:hypothetical protein
LDHLSFRLLAPGILVLLGILLGILLAFLPAFLPELLQ